MLINWLILLQDFYGVDWDGPIPAEPESRAVEVPHTSNPLQPDDFTNMKNVIDPLRHSNNFGSDIFLECKQFVHAHQH